MYSHVLRSNPVSLDCLKAEDKRENAQKILEMYPILQALHQVMSHQKKHLLGFLK